MPIEQLTGLPDNIEDLISEALAPFGYIEPIGRDFKETDGGASYWQDLNQSALANLDKWVPDLGLPKTKKMGGQNYRSVAEWRGVENPNLSFSEKGIKDFGNGEGHSPIDVVSLAKGMNFESATEWLANQLNFIWITETDDFDLTGFIERSLAKQASRKVVKADLAPSTGDTEPQAKERFQITWFDDVDQSVTKDELVEGVLGAGEFSLFIAQPGMGKSVLVGDLGLHVAAGKDWHGRKVKQGLVVFFAAERKSLTERRIAAWRKKHDVSGIPFVVVGGKLDLTSNVFDAKALAATIANLERKSGYPCVLIILDTVTRTFGSADQHQSQAMQKYIQSVDELGRSTGAHVAAIHHSPHSDTGRGKGAIDLDGAIDKSFVVSTTGKEPNKVFTLVCSGTNDGIDGLITSFKLETVSLGTDANGNATTAPVVVQADTSKTDGSNLKGQNAKAFDSLERAIAAKGETLPDGTSGIPDGVSTVTREQWHEQFFADAKATQPKALQETVKRGLNRAIADLATAKQIEMVGERFWIPGQPGHVPEE